MCAGWPLVAAQAVGGDGAAYVADRANHAVRRIRRGGEASTLAGSKRAGRASHGAADGVGTAARFSYPCGIAVGADGVVYLADTHNHLIRRISAAGEVTTFAGSTRGSQDGPVKERCERTDLWVFVMQTLISSARLHPHPAGVHRTCRRADEIEVTVAHG